MNDKTLSGWALILGASSGFGAASCRALAAAGMDIAGVHLDTRATLPRVQDVIHDVEAQGQKALFFNVNAADECKRQKVLDELLGEAGPGSVKLVLHSLAFGSLLPLVAAGPGESLTKAQMEMTLDVMAHSLVYWTQDLVWRDLLAGDARVYAMTSAGSHRAFPSYGAVGAAKAALESHIRYLALELAPRNIKFNAIQAGITDTPALRQIPGHESAIRQALKRHPYGRMTEPEDVARALVALSAPGCSWMTGQVIRVDGGEDNVA
ncbi:MAG TPA: SDR family oxidoreductase [Anaerolineae bacterium]|nr:SDR family oxidoreductase [Anaerolineae bacterium]